MEYLLAFAAVIGIFVAVTLAFLAFIGFFELATRFPTAASVIFVFAIFVGGQTIKDMRSPSVLVPTVEATK